MAIARRKRYGTGSSTVQHEEQLERWIRKSDTFIDLANRKQPAQLILDVSLWQLRRQFRRLPCFNHEVRVHVLISVISSHALSDLTWRSYSLFALTKKIARD